MTGKGRRDKGIKYEQKVRRELIDLGFSECQTSRYESKKQDDRKIDLCNTGPFNFQLKAQESGVGYHRLLGEMPKGSTFNVVLHKRNRKEIVAMSKADFFELVKMLIYNKII